MDDPVFDKNAPHRIAAKCRQLGEEQVRQIVANRSGTPEWLAEAERWLLQIDREAEKDSQAESLEIARSAKDAAWEAANAARDAAREAKTANTIATLALIAAAVAIAISIIAIFVT